jgi:hypothetical protein
MLLSQTGKRDRESPQPQNSHQNKAQIEPKKHLLETTISEERYTYFREVGGLQSWDWKHEDAL